MVPPGRSATAQAPNTGSGTPPKQKTGFQEKTGDGQRVEQPPRCADALPSPPPLPAGKGSESPSVVKGAGGRPAALKPPTPMTRASIVPAASRAGAAPLKSSPVQTRCARLAAASGFTLDPSSTQKPCRLTYSQRRQGLGHGARMPAAPVFRPVARFFRPHPCRAMPEGQKTRLAPSFWPLLP